MTHVVTHFTVEGATNTVFWWVDWWMYSALIVKECLDIMRNGGKLDPSLMPKRLIKLFKDFDETGKFIDPDISSPKSNDNVQNP